MCPKVVKQGEYRFECSSLFRTCRYAHTRTQAHTSPKGLYRHLTNLYSDHIDPLTAECHSGSIHIIRFSELFERLLDGHADMRLLVIVKTNVFPMIQEKATVFGNGLLARFLVCQHIGCLSVFLHDPLSVALLRFLPCMSSSCLPSPSRTQAPP